MILGGDPAFPDQHFSEGGWLIGRLCSTDFKKLVQVDQSRPQSQDAKKSVADNVCFHARSRKR